MPRRSFGERSPMQTSVLSRLSEASSERSPTPGRQTPRRQSIFDLLFLLRRSSKLKSQKPKITLREDRNDEGDLFLTGESEDEDQPLTREALLEKIRQKKEVIEKLRCQPWSMRRKRKTLKLAQKHLEKHESKVSRTHLYKEELSRRWKKFVRWFGNISIYLIPWEAKIKRIENLSVLFGSLGHFGSVVSSYFTFLRWIFWVNLMITFIVTLFVVIPECLADMSASDERKNATFSRKHLRQGERESADKIQTLWDYNGYIKVSPVFYGYYSELEYMRETVYYQIPLAYFLVNLFVFGYSFFAILRKMAENARMSKLASGKTEQYTFNWKVYTGWDYTIGNPEAASNTVMANVNKLKEAIAEYRVKLQQKFICLRFVLRVLANAIILGLIAVSCFVIVKVVERSKEDETQHDSFRRNEVPIVVSFITLVFPNIFEIVGKMERYHPRTSLRLHLGRILCLYVINYYTLIYALFTKMDHYIAIAKMRQGLDASQANITSTTVSINSQRFDSQTLTRLQRSIQEGPELQSFHHLTRHKLRQRRKFRALQNHASSGRMFEPVIDLLSHSWRKNMNRLFFPTQAPPHDNSISSFPHLGKRQLSSEYYEYSTEPSSNRTDYSDSKNGELASVTPELTWWLAKFGVQQKDNMSQEQLKDYMESNPTMETNKLSTKPSTTTEPSTTTTTTKPPTITILSSTTKSEFKHGSPQKLISGSLDNLCWETLIGQEICKLITTDLVMNIASILAIDFFRGLWVRYCNRWWCWNLETTFPEYGEFKVAENVLHIINNQGMIWLGLFFTPLLPAINNVKLIVLMYIRGWACTSCNVPAQQIFRASRSSNFYLVLLLLMLFLCTIPVGYVIASKEPSITCGPFSGKKLFYNIITDQMQATLPPNIMETVEYVASPGVIIPVLVLLILIIYFLVSLIRGMRAANEDLQKQLAHERTEEKRKIYQLAGGGASRKETEIYGPTLPDSTQVDLSFLPTFEQRRREAWRKKPPLLIEEERFENHLSPFLEEDESQSDVITERPSGIVALCRGAANGPAAVLRHVADIESGLESPSSPEIQPHEPAVIVADDSAHSDEKLLATTTSSDTDDAQRKHGQVFPAYANGRPVVPPLKMKPDSEDGRTDSLKPMEESEIEPSDDDRASVCTVEEVQTPHGIREMLSVHEPHQPYGVKSFPSEQDLQLASPVPLAEAEVYTPTSDTTNYDNITPRDAKLPPTSSDAFKISPQELEKLLSPFGSPRKYPWETREAKDSANTELDDMTSSCYGDLVPIRRRDVTPEMLLQLTQSPSQKRKSQHHLDSAESKEQAKDGDKHIPESGTDSELDRFTRQRLVDADSKDEKKPVSFEIPVETELFLKPQGKPIEHTGSLASGMPQSGTDSDLDRFAKSRVQSAPTMVSDSSFSETDEMNKTDEVEEEEEEEEEGDAREQEVKTSLQKLASKVVTDDKKEAEKEPKDKKVQQENQKPKQPAEKPAGSKVPKSAGLPIKKSQAKTKPEPYVPGARVSRPCHSQKPIDTKPPIDKSATKVQKTPATQEAQKPRPRVKISVSPSSSTSRSSTDPTKKKFVIKQMESSPPSYRSRTKSALKPTDGQTKTAVSATIKSDISSSEGDGLHKKPVTVTFSRPKRSRSSEETEV